MIKRSRTALHALLAPCLAALLYGAVAPCHALAASPEPTNENRQDIGFYGEVEVEYSDNIFHLTDFQKSLMDENDAENIESGRFSDMESTSDTIVSPAFGIRYDTRGLGDGDLRLSGQVKYNFHVENQDKSYPEARIRLKNDIGKKGALVLEGNFLFDFFKKNYLSGFDDENDNGNIARDERIYSRAVYDEYEGILAYEHELYKEKDDFLSQVDLQPYFGFSTRSYNAPFDNRGRDVVFGGLALTLEFLSRIDLDLAYRYENARYPGDDELVLFDETLLDRDVNGDGEIAGNAPLVTPIDRSADRHTFEIRPSVKLTKDLQLSLGYEKRISDYTSGNPLDLDHYENTSYRKKIEAGLRYDLSKSWSTKIEYRMTDDEDDEDGDYSENCFTFSIRYELP